MADTLFFSSYTDLISSKAFRLTDQYFNEDLTKRNFVTSELVKYAQEFKNSKTPIELEVLMHEKLFKIIRDNYKGKLNASEEEKFKTLETKTLVLRANFNEYLTEEKLQKITENAARRLR